MRIIAIDPGTEKSGWCVLDCIADRLEGFGWDDNEAVRNSVPRRFGFGEFSKDVLAIEMIASQGMAVGKETFRTVWWTGRFADTWLRTAGYLPMEVYRKDVKLHLCGQTRAKDKNVRQALIDHYGGEGGKDAAIGKKASPGPLFGVSNHVWSALAVAKTAQARMQGLAA